jgi:U3 small nucleolar RNA-associated protein 25
MATSESSESVTTRLLTLLNVSALSTKKRKRVEEPTMPLPPSKKLNAKKSVSMENAKNRGNESNLGTNGEIDSGDAVFEDSKEPEGMLYNVSPIGSDTPIPVENDPYKVHFGPYPKHLTEQTRTAVDKRTWITSKRKCGKVGEACVQVPSGLNTEETSTGSFVCHRFPHAEAS